MRRTVGELKKRLEGFPDHAPVLIEVMGSYTGIFDVVICEGRYYYGIWDVYEYGDEHAPPDVEDVVVLYSME